MNAYSIKKSHLVMMIIAVISMLSFSASAATWNVPGNFSSIQAAIDSTTVNNGDEIIVAPGTYYENIDFKGKNLIIASQVHLSSTKISDYNSIINNTVLDGQQNDSVVKFAGTETANCKIKGFTIYNGKSGDTGGGIKGNGTSATVELNKITSNTAELYGGGIDNVDGIIQNNLITANGIVYKGGALYDCDGTVRYNQIYNNLAYYGAGLFACGAFIHNNLIFNNSASLIGGALAECDYKIINNTIIGNRAEETGGALFTCNGEIINNIIYSNYAPQSPQIYVHQNGSLPSYCCIQNWTGGGSNNSTQEPLLADVAKRDFTLVDNSPCIDSGNPAVEYNDRCLPPGKGTSRNDKGAYGYINCDWQSFWDIGIEPIFSSKCPGQDNSWVLIDPVQSITTGKVVLAPASFFDVSGCNVNMHFPVFTTGSSYYYYNGYAEATSTLHDMKRDIIQYASDSMYVLKFKLNTDSTVDVPQVRVRVQENGNAWTACGLYSHDPSMVTQFGPFGGTPGLTPTEMILAWEPQGPSQDDPATSYNERDAFLNFDMYPALVFGGDITLSEYAVYRIPKSEITATTVKSISSFVSGGNESQFGSTTTNKPTFANNTLQYPDISGWNWIEGTSFVKTAGTPVIDALYRLKFTMNKTTPERTDQMRMRVADANNYAYTTNFVLASGNQVLTNSQEYVHYHKLANKTLAPGWFTSYSADFAVALDRIDLGPNDTTPATVVLTKLEIERLTLPELAE